MALTKNAHIRLTKHYSDVYQAMLDELPPDLWLELHDRVQKRMYYAWELSKCTSFKVVE